MCGIAGILNLKDHSEISTKTLKQMISVIRHRGPDEFGLYQDKQVGFAHARLSIIDLEGGKQPIHNEDKTLWIVYNGEVYNHVELRQNLIQRGHTFHTRTDTEVLLHLYEDFGDDFVQHLNGQFAFAIWDKKENKLILGRDRLGVRPLYYTITDGKLIFASEIKAIFTDPRVTREIDPKALNQIFTFWTTLSPNTVFKGIFELPPGHIMVASSRGTETKSYWGLQFPANGLNHDHSESFYVDQFRELLSDATNIRLRADVPVGAYLSGGLDSSAITALIKKAPGSRLKTFSIQFTDKDFDESTYQDRMVQYLGTDHRSICCSYEDVGKVFPDVIWHSEIPLLRTSPAPMFLLSKLVRENDIKVVLTGEGADEMLAGYNIFKEAKVRCFWARQPESRCRPLLLERLYPYLAHSPAKTKAYLVNFFRVGLSQIDKPHFSHIPRWENTSKLKMFFSKELKKSTQTDNNYEQIDRLFPPNWHQWDSMARAQFIETTVFMSNYLLSSQGDRMAMANSVEGRYPFLDHRVIEFCSQVPSKYKMHVLNEKYLLKKSMEQLLPESVFKRHKQPYRAPIRDCFFGPSAPDYVAEMLSEEQIKKAGYFDPKMVQGLIKKAESGRMMGEKDNMAIAGILSTQLLDYRFVQTFESNVLQPAEVIKMFGHGD